MLKGAINLLKVFLSGSFREKEKIVKWMEKLSSLKNVEIIYDWTKHVWDEDRRKYAEENIIAINDCNVFVFDVGEQGSLGKSIALGIAIAFGKEIFVIGKFPEIIYGELIEDDHKFETFEEFYESLSD